VKQAKLSTPAVAEKIPTAILISGRGSNMRALIEAAEDVDYPAKIALVVSNAKDALGLKVAKEAGIKTAVIEHKTFGKDRSAFEQALQEQLEKEKIQFICLAGFMRVLSSSFIEKWPQRIINIHPSLLPAFPGLDTHKRALAAKINTHGCTVHYVSSIVDSGEIIGQMRVPVLEDDTEEKLAARVLEAEHKLYPKTLGLALSRLAQMHFPNKKQA
jgi:formyltetrahydrofolate-dependent phosphoribosylglycinamide formyltransferase